MPCESMMSQNQDYSSEGGIPKIVKLNVGGQYFTTSRQTLTSDPNSMLQARKQRLLETVSSLSTEMELTSAFY